MEVRSQSFKDNAREALADAQLQRALRNVPRGFIDKREKAKKRLPEFEDLREQARNAIGERRADEELTKYIRRLRAEAYIENRLTGTVNDASGQRALGRQ